MEKILVTGGLGTVGAFVCRWLLDTARQPVIYDWGADVTRISDFAAECIIENGAIGDLPRLLGVVSRYRPAAIFHLAGRVGPQVEEFPWSSIDTNLLGAATVFECARLSAIKRVVFASSKNVYGPVGEKYQHPLYEPVPEEHPREPVKLYGKLKRACEDVADHYAQQYGLDVIALRFGASIAPKKIGSRSKVSPVMGLIEAAIAGRPFRIESGAEQCDDLCYAGESANAFIAALDSAPQQGHFRAYNISSGELISLGEMIRVLKDIYPSWDAEAGAGLDYRHRGLGYYFRMAIRKAARELNFKPRFDFRRIVIDYAERLERLGKGTFPS